jgi:hypothetical protein
MSADIPGEIIPQTVDALSAADRDRQQRNQAEDQQDKEKFDPYAHDGAKPRSRVKAAGKNTSAI